MIFHGSYSSFCFGFKYLEGWVGLEEMYSVYNMVQKWPCQVCQCLMQHQEPGDIATKEFLEDVYSHLLLTEKLNASI